MKKKEWSFGRERGNFCPPICCSASWLQYSQLPTLLPLQFLFSLLRHLFSHVVFSPSLNNALCFQFAKKLLISLAFIFISCLPSPYFFMFFLNILKFVLQFTLVFALGFLQERFFSGDLDVAVLWLPLVFVLKTKSKI